MCRFKLFTALNGMLCIDVSILYILLELLTIGQSVMYVHMYIVTFVLLQITTVSSSNSLPDVKHGFSSTTSCDSNPAVHSSKENTEEGVRIPHAYM